MVKYCTSDFAPQDSVEFARQDERNLPLQQQQQQIQNLGQAPSFNQQQPTRGQNLQASFNNQRPDPRVQSFRGQDIRERTPKATSLNNQRLNSGFRNQNNQRDARNPTTQRGHITSREQFTRERALRLLGI